MIKIYTYSVSSGSPHFRKWIVRVISDNREAADAQAVRAAKEKFPEGKVGRFLGCRQPPLVTWALHHG